MIPPEHNLGFSIAWPAISMRRRAGESPTRYAREPVLDALQPELECAVDVAAEAEGAGQLHIDEARRPRRDETGGLERGIRPHEVIGEPQQGALTRASDSAAPSTVNMSRNPSGRSCAKAR